MRSPIPRDLGRRHVFDVAFGFGAARPAVGAPRSTPAAVAREVIGACTWMSGGVVSLPALLDYACRDLLVGKCLPDRRVRGDQDCVCQCSPRAHCRIFVGGSPNVKHVLAVVGRCFTCDTWWDTPA